MNLIDRIERTSSSGSAETALTTGANLIDRIESQYVDDKSLRRAHDVNLIDRIERESTRYPVRLLDSNGLLNLIDRIERWDRHVAMDEVTTELRI